jgi:hypothetical protein
MFVVFIVEHRLLRMAYLHAREFPVDVSHIMLLLASEVARKHRVSTVALHLDHAFIMCNVGAPEAEALVARGFVEGSPNVHPGQGTANRRFFFTNFMLELLWVVDPIEAAKARHTGLWERWSQRDKGASPFGIVYGGVPVSRPPFVTEPYHPAYLPPSMSIEIVQGIALGEPALFWIPSLSTDRARRGEPTNHSAPVRSVTRVVIGLPNIDTLSDAARRVCAASLLDFVETPAPVLEVRFRGENENSMDCRPHLPLVFRAA